MTMTSIEICAGAGGQALGLELAGFEHAALVEIEAVAQQTLLLNRPKWNVVPDGDVRRFSGSDFQGADLLAGGVPCPPFSKAGRQLGKSDDRDLFPEAIRLVEEIQPKAVMLENVRGLLDSVFDSYRKKIQDDLRKLGYAAQWRLLNASDFGVPQLRPRVIFVAIRRDLEIDFEWPLPNKVRPPSVGECLFDLMSERGWKLASRWKDWANDIAPTLVGGSKKHGGPDLGPTRAKDAWASIGVDGHGLADEAPDPKFHQLPRLTVRMAARIQGFPDDWAFHGRKTAAYRQIGNAFPPPVAKAVGGQIAAALEARARRRVLRAA
ncbi:DNA cytosine methyltransferase [Ramlibacter sp. WS9]|uniref:DNA cytosine methyltransferase n=1 Tax=Ramlibacter sp. WS9 TaxID=1882741 RepID=UPI0011434F41|nr:DNA cytosine methyltransferase [Ramlibacter sp. WS9]ROZ66246.1 DNA cytosine methyltransferase [Ramlibacter sp. WS9]